MTTITTAAVLDRRGKTITTFIVYDALAELDKLNEGEALELLTDDYEPIERDVAAWCDSTGHRLVASEGVAQGRRFLIEKGAEVAKDTNLAMSISVDGLTELLVPLGYALAAALEGIQVHLYFNGPAVRVLSREYRPRMKGIARPISRFAAAGMAKTGHIPAQDKLRQVRSLGGQIYVCGPSMDHFKVEREDLIFDDLPLIEYLTFMAIMERSDIQLYL